MKRNFENLYVLFLLLITVLMDIAGYMACHTSGLHPEKSDMFVMCSVLTFFVVCVAVFHFHLYNVRITPKRLQLGWICFRSYFTRTALKEQGNLLTSISYACIASYHFFLISYKG